MATLRSLLFTLFILTATACGTCDDSATQDTNPNDLGNSADSGTLVSDSDTPSDSEDEGTEDTGIDDGSHSLDIDMNPPEDVGGDGGQMTSDGSFCRSGWCWEHPLLFGTHLEGVWGSGPNDVWAVGNAGTIARYDGNEWALVETGISIEFRAIAGSASDDIWAVGLDGGVAYYDGTSWSEPSSPTTEDLRDIFVLSSDSVYFVGGGRAILHWDGSTLSVVEEQEFATGYFAVWGSSADDIWVAGPNNLAKRWTGTEWEATGGIFYNFGDVDDLWGSGPDDVYAVGTYNASRWDGTSWSDIAFDPIVSPMAIVGTGADDVWLLGGPNSMHWDGADWSTVDELADEYLTDAWLSASGDGWAVGSAGRILRQEGGLWSAQSGLADGTHTHYYAVHARTEDDVWVAAGFDVLRYDGTQWETISQEPIRTSSIWAAGPQDVWIGGWSGVPDSIQRWTGTEFEPVERQDTIGSINDVWGAEPDDVWFAGDDNGLLHWNGSEMEIVYQDVGSLRMNIDIDGSGADDVWVVGGYGAILHYNGTEWTTRNLDDDFDLGLVHVAARDDVWTAGSWESVLYHWDGSSWSMAPFPDVQFDTNGNRIILALSGTSDNLWAAGSGGNVFHYDGTEWTRVTNFGVRISDIDHAGSSAWAVGSGGAILRRNF